MIARRAAVLWGGWLTVAAVTGLGIGAGTVAWERPLPGPPVRTADDGTGEHSAVQTAPCSHEDPAAARCTTTTAAAEGEQPEQEVRPSAPSTPAARPTPRPAPRESHQPESGGRTSTPPGSTPAERDQEEVGDSGGRSGAPSPSSSATSTPDEPEPSHEPEPCPTTDDPDPDPDTDEAEACDE